MINFGLCMFQRVPNGTHNNLKFTDANKMGKRIP